jgi:hypothetical protein
MALAKSHHFMGFGQNLFAVLLQDEGLSASQQRKNPGRRGSN